MGPPAEAEAYSEHHERSALSVGPEGQHGPEKNRRNKRERHPRHEEVAVVHDPEYPGTRHEEDRQPGGQPATPGDKRAEAEVCAQPSRQAHRHQLQVQQGDGCKAVSCDHVKKRADIAKCWCHPDRGNRPVELVGALPHPNGKDARTNLGHGVGQNRAVPIGVTASRDIWDKKAPHQPKRRSSHKNEPKAGLEAGSSMAPEPRGASSAPAHEGAEIERGDPGNRDPWRAEPQASRGEAPNGHPRHAHRNDHQEAPEHRRHSGTGARRGFRLGARRHDRRRHESAGEREEGERGYVEPDQSA